MKHLAFNPRKPDDWARDASSEHGWLHAYKIAKKHATEFLGKDSGVRNPHLPYWSKVIVYIEKNAPPKALEEQEQPELQMAKPRKRKK